MADRYWVGGTGISTDPAHWSISSGGGGGASVFSTDNIIFDANSGAGNANVVSMTVASMTITSTCSLLSISTTSLTVTGDVTHNSKELSVGNNQSWGRYITTGTAARTFRNNTATLTLTSTGEAWSVQDATNYTLLITNGDIKFTNATAATPKAMRGAGLTYKSVRFEGDGAFWIIDSFTVQDFYMRPLSSSTSLEISDIATLTITGNFDVSGTDTIKLSLRCRITTLHGTISKTSGTVVCEYMDIKDITVTGGATWIAPRSIDNGNNSGWIFPKAGIIAAF